MAIATSFANARRQSPRPGSQQARATDLGAAHQAAEGAGVVNGEVLAAAVVPEGDRTGLPAEATGELGAMTVLDEIVEERTALRFRHALEALRVGAVDIEQLAPGFGVRDHHRMCGDRLPPIRIFAHLGGALRVPVGTGSGHVAVG